MSTVATIMQPYLWPYAGYYRLLAAADVFVVFDCVQFIRRGRIHRNEFTTREGFRWLTLPLRKPGRTDRIDSVRLSDDAASEFVNRLRPFEALAAGLRRTDAAGEHVPRPGAALVDFLVGQLRATARLLGFGCEIVRSSSFGIPTDVRGADRILALCNALDARRYVNVDGGRSLYDRQQFAARGVTLRFLAPYRGSMLSVQERLASEDADLSSQAAAIRAEIEANVVYA